MAAAQDEKLLPMGSAAPLGSTQPDMFRYNNLYESLNDSISYVFKNYDLEEPIQQMKSIILNATFVEDLLWTNNRKPFLEKAIEPLSQSLAQMDGPSFVETMSQDAQDIYLKSAVFWSVQGNMSAWNSAYWQNEVPYESRPENALKCAAQKGKCQCPLDGIVYYGAKGSDGFLDMSKDYTSREAFHHGYTPCKDSYFGNETLPGQKKYCFCDEMAAHGRVKHKTCGTEGGNCECEVGGNVVFGTSNGRDTFNFKVPHVEKDADRSGITPCSKAYFGSRPDKQNAFDKLQCFCEPPPKQVKNYCKYEYKQTGCFNDDVDVPDYQELLDSSVFSVDHCMQLVFDNYYMYGGIKNGTECWGSNLLTGKYGSLSNDQCNVTCKDGSQCGGEMANSEYRLNYMKNKLCGGNITFNELDISGKVLPNSKGRLTNPSGDGQNFTWMFGGDAMDSFNLYALRNKYGDVRGFTATEENPYYEEGLKWINWDQTVNEDLLVEFKMWAMGMTFVGSDDFMTTYTDEEMDKIYQDIAVETLLEKEKEGSQAELEAQLEAEAQAEKEQLLADAIAAAGGNVDEATLALLQAQAEAKAERKKQDQLAQAQRDQQDEDAEEKRQKLQDDAEAEALQVTQEAEAEALRLQEEAEAEKQTVLAEAEAEKERLIQEAEAEKERLIAEAQAEIERLYSEAATNQAEQPVTIPDYPTTILDELPGDYSDFNQTQYELDLINEINAEYEAEKQKLSEEAAKILAEAEAEKERILNEAEVERQSLDEEAEDERQALMDEALANIDELYALMDKPDMNEGDWTVDDEFNFEDEFDFGDDFEEFQPADPYEDLDHTDVGTIWFGVNDEYKDQTSDVDESEWMVTLTHDISYYYMFGGLPGLWLFTQEQECFLEFDRISGDVSYFTIDNTFPDCGKGLPGNKIKIQEKDGLFYFTNLNSGMKATLSEDIEYVAAIIIGEVGKQYEDHISAEEFAERTAGLVDASLYDDYITPEMFAALTEGLISADEINWEDHGHLMDIPEDQFQMPDVDMEGLHDGETYDPNAAEYFPEFAVEFTVYGLPEQYTIDQIESDTTAYGKFAAITSDAAGYAASREVSFWFYDMNGNFCMMTAETKLDKITSFTISDPYAMCSHSAWKTAAVKYDGPDLVQFRGPEGEWFNIFTEDELYTEPDTSMLDWYEQITKANSWYVVPAQYELIDIANDNNLFGDLWYFTKFDNQGTYFLLDMNANYQCLVTLQPEGDNKATVELKDYANCVMAPNSFPAMEAEKEGLQFSFEGEDYFFISEKEWDAYFASL